MLATIGRGIVSVIPARRLVVIVAALSPIWLVSESAAAFALAVVAVAVIVDLLLLPAKWQVAAQRIVPANVGLGDKERGEYRVKSNAPRVLHFSLFDALPSIVESPEERGTMHDVSPGG